MQVGLSREPVLHAAEEGDRRRPLWKQLEEIRRHRLVFGFGIVLPLAVYLVFVGYPISYTFYLSFQQWNGFSNVVKFVGLANYRHLINDSNFWLSFSNTVKWIIGTLFFTDVLAFILAVVLRSKSIYFGAVLRAFFFLPVTMSLIAIGLMFSFILTPAFGGVGLIAQALGFPRGPDLLGQPATALYTLIGVFGWSYLGIPLVLFDAGLTQIPEELNEAARLEGATPLQQLRFVTLPMLRPTFVVVTVLAVLEAIRTFDLVYAMTGGGPGHSSDTLGYYMWIQSFDERHFGYGAAISTVMLLLSSLFAMVYVRRAGRAALEGGG